MDKVAWSVFNAFIHRRDPNKRDALLSLLPEDKRQIAKALSPTEKDPLTSSFDEHDLIDSVHPSWLSSLIRGAPDGELGLYLAALSPEASLRIQKELLYSKPLLEIPPIAKGYIRQQLFLHLLDAEADFLPASMLPHSPLTSLLDLNPYQLKTIVEFLGLHDLSVDMKQIIDSARLKKIQACLQPEAQNYLAHLASKKEPVLFKKLELSHWDGRSDTLKKVIYQRGMNRLAKALFPEHPMLKWHIARRLSTEDAPVLYSLCKPLEHEKAYALLVHQILEVMPLTQKQQAKKTL